MPDDIKGLEWRKLYKRKKYTSIMADNKGWAAVVAVISSTYPNKA